MATWLVAHGNKICAVDYDFFIISEYLVLGNLYFPFCIAGRYGDGEKLERLLRVLLLEAGHWRYSQFVWINGGKCSTIKGQSYPLFTRAHTVDKE